MTIKTAFTSAAAKFPERERRVALAMFVNRYALPWPISDYRCDGLDADVIKAFLEGCGMKAGADYEDVVSALAPSAHQIKWISEPAVKHLASLLGQMLRNDAARNALYVAQIDRTEDPAPGLADERALGDAEFWDPLGLHGSTKKVAEKLKESGGHCGEWARGWLALQTMDRDVMAPLWALEAVFPRTVGLFVPTVRSSGGRTAHVPFFLGRYVTRGESLRPPFPMIASYPVANTWGDSEMHRFCPLDGYVTRTVRDLLDIPPDKAKTPASGRRDAWMHVESAYVNRATVTDSGKVAMLTRPEELWDYVAALYEHAYGKRVVLVPGACLVHVGDAGDEDMTSISAIDDEVRNADRLEVRPSIVILNEDPDPSKPNGSSLVGRNDGNLVVLPGEPKPDATGWERSPAYMDNADAAAEWYLMTHASAGLPGGTSRERISGGEPGRVGKLRKWLAESPHLPSDTVIPDDVAFDSSFELGYRAPAHFTCQFLDDFRRKFSDGGFFTPDPALWRGANPEIHMSEQLVVAMHSKVLGDGDEALDLLRVTHTPAGVTSALDVLAGPAVQLSEPARPTMVQIVVETNVRYPASGYRMDTVTVEFLKNMFLWSFQANQRRNGNLTILSRGCDISVHEAMNEELEDSGVREWSALYAGTEAVPHAGTDYEWHLPGNRDDTRVCMLQDSHGRLVIAFGLVLGSPAERICRATYRYYTNLPLLTNEGMRKAVELRAAKYVTIPEGSGRSVVTAFDSVVKAHTGSGCRGVVPGWTDWRDPVAAEIECSSTVPEHEAYRRAAEDEPPLTAEILAKAEA